MNDTLQQQLMKLFGADRVNTKASSLYALPNGGETRSYLEYKRAWEIYHLMCNVRNCHTAKKLTRCF